MKVRSILLALVAIAFVACGGGSGSSGGSNIAEPAQPWVDFVIETEEILVPETEDYPEYTVMERTQVCLSKFDLDTDGWYIIFDGTSLNGWRGYNREDVPSRWTIDEEEGALKFSGARQGESQAGDGGDIIFARKFRNFHVSIDWKVSQAGNSGIFYLAQEIKGRPIFISAPESQVLDNENHPDALAGANRMSSSLYDMIAAVPQNANPFGEWNNTTIIVDRGNVYHHQNGTMVVSYNLWTDKWTEMLNESKFSKEKWPLAFELLNKAGGCAREGYIGLQDHGDDVWFKNIKVKVLPD